MSWAHATQAVLGVLIVFGSAYTWWPSKRNRRIRPRPVNPCVIDYSAKRAERLTQLGPDYLLAKPLNRSKP